MKKLYCFDFDGTLTTKDTMFQFLRYYDRKKYYWALAKHLPLFALLKVKLLPAEPVKRSFISSVLKGERKEKLEQRAQIFFDSKHQELLRELAKEFLDSRNKELTQSVLVTASLDVWTKPFADFYEMDLIATRAQFKEGVFTGKFLGTNCNGEEKVNRLKDYLIDRSFDKIIAFGDTSNDYPMMEFAQESHFRFFH